MTICDHQFQGGDESDWVLSTSVGCLDGSTTASRILRELFKKHCRNLASEGSRKRPKTVAAAPENDPPSRGTADTGTRLPPTQDEPEEPLIVRKIPGTSGLENFDESQHLNGCPMKWLYNKRLLERSKKLPTGRLCSKRSPRKEEDEVKRERPGNLRDRTPVEVKIHKINLMEKYTTNSDETYARAAHPKDLDARRKKLAAKLNWKLHDESQDERPLETSSETGSRHDYFPPRPLLGLKPLLSVLLAPHQPTCPCLVTRLQGIAPKRKGRGASLSIQSLDLSYSREESKPRPKTTNALRWGSKSCANAKKLQVPNRITIKLDQKKHKSAPTTETDLKVSYHNPPVKRKSEGRKQTKSLSSLFYELRGKTNSGQNDDVFEDMIRDLTAEGRFKIKRFLSFGVENSDPGRGCKTKGGKKEKFPEEETAVANESNLVCGKVRFFRKSLPKENKTRGWETVGCAC